MICFHCTRENLIGGEQINFQMENIRLTAMAILVIGFSLQVHGIAGRTFVFGCSNYTFHMASKSILSWVESRRICNKTGSDLVSIETLEEWHFLKSTIQPMQTSEYFIGLKKQSENWKWVCNYGEEIASKGYIKWARNQPSGNGNCTAMWGKDHLWYDDVSCDRGLSAVGYICERAANCNDEKGRTFVFGSSTYTFHMAPKSKPVGWEDSRCLCNKTGSDLVSIETLEEWRFLNSTIHTMETSEYFIGLKKQSENWKWVCNYGKEIASKGYLNWGTREPSGNGECTKMWGKDRLWYDDTSCDRGLSNVGYICERAAKCHDEKEIIYNGACNGESTTEPVTSPTKASSKLQSTNAATVKTPSVKSAMHSTSSIKRQNSKECNDDPGYADVCPTKATIGGYCVVHRQFMQLHCRKSCGCQW